MSVPYAEDGHDRQRSRSGNRAGAGWPPAAGGGPRRGVHLRLGGAGQAGRHGHRHRRVLPLPAGAAGAGRAGRDGAAPARPAAGRPRAARARCSRACAWPIDLVLWNHAIADVGRRHRHRARQPAGAVRRRRRLAAVAGAARARRFLLALPVVLAGVVLVSGLAGHGTGGGHPLAGIGLRAGHLGRLRRASCSSCARPRPARRTSPARSPRPPPGAAAGAAAARPGFRRLAAAMSAGRPSAGCWCWP